MIRLFEQFNNEQEIRDICKEYKIKNYTINPDGSIDVDGDVLLYNKGLTKLPLRFNNVSGYLNCCYNKLTTLEGSPNYVGTYFYCNNNQLTTLEGSPNYVGTYFICCYNELTSLVGSPNEVGVNFNCSFNKLTSLEYSPERVGGSFYCSNNKIISLKGSPIIIDSNLELIDNPISIIDSSVEVKGDIYLDSTNFDDRIKSLSQDKLRILFEHGVDYNIFDKDGSINDYRLERLFKDFNI